MNPVYLLLGVFCDVFRWRRLWFLLLWRRKIKSQRVKSQHLLRPRQSPKHQLLRSQLPWKECPSPSWTGYVHWGWLDLVCWHNWMTRCHIRKPCCDSSCSFVWRVGISDSSKGGAEATGSHDSRPCPGGPFDDDVPAPRAGQDPPECICHGEETSFDNGSGL